MSNRNAKQWAILSFIFLFLGLDEAMMIHDGLSEPFKSITNFPDFLFFAWVIPYAVLVFVFVLYYLKLFFGFSTKFKFLFFLSGFIYVFGALGMEIIGASRMANFGGGDIQYIVFMTIEETLELAGIVLFNFTLLSYINETIANKNIKGFFIDYNLY